MSTKSILLLALYLLPFLQVSAQFDEAKRIWSNNANPNLKIVGIADFDGDEQDDYLILSPTNGGSSWYLRYKNMPGQEPSNCQMTPLAYFPSSPESVALHDYDQDGDVDILFISDEKLKVLNNNGYDDFNTSILSEYAAGTIDDIDGDGDLDVLAQEDYYRWYENTGNYQDWVEHSINSSYAGRILGSGHFNNDGIIDFYNQYVDGFAGPKIGLLVSDDDQGNYSVQSHFSFPEQSFYNGSFHQLSPGANGAGEYHFAFWQDQEVHMLKVSHQLDQFAVSHISKLSEIQDPNSRIRFSDIDENGLIDVIVHSWDRPSLVTAQVNADDSFEVKNQTNLVAKTGAYLYEAVRTFGNHKQLYMACTGPQLQTIEFEDGLAKVKDNVCIEPVSELASISIVDHNRDGLPDILFYCSESNNLAWIENLGGGDFADIAHLFHVPDGFQLQVDEVTGDENLDMIFGYFDYIYSRLILSVVPGPDWSFSNRLELDDIDSQVAQLVDLNGDGVADICTNQDYYYLQEGSYYKKSFASSDSAFSIYGTKDLDGNGLMDIILRNESSNAPEWRLQKQVSPGSFVSEELRFLNEPVSSLEIADINKDGYLDMAAVVDPVVQLHFYGPNSTVEKTLTIDRAKINRIQFVNLNGDEIPDLFLEYTNNNEDTAVEIYTEYERNSEPAYEHVIGAREYIFTDFDQDGFDDILSIRREDRFAEVLINNSDPLPEEKQIVIGLQPNPASSYTRIPSSFLGSALEVNIYNSQGMQIGNYPIMERLNTTEFSPGLYFVELTMADGSRLIERLIIV